MVAVVAIVATCIALAAFGGRAIVQRRAAKRAATAWARLSRCLVGTPPLGSAEAPEPRLRRIELGILERKASHAEDPGDAEWPRRCAKFGDALSREWGDDAATIDGPLASLVPDLQRGKLPSPGNFVESNALAVVLRMGATLRATPDDVGDVPMPPAAAQLLDFTQAAMLSRETLISDAVPVVDRSLRLLPHHSHAMWEVQGAADPSKTLMHARSIEVSSKIPAASNPRLVGVEDGATPVVAISGFAGEGGLYSLASGERLVSAAMPETTGGWGKANGSVATIDNIETKGAGDPVHASTYQLLRRSSAGVVTRTAVDRPRWTKQGVFEAHVVAGWLMWLEGPDAVETNLRAREILDGDPAVGPVFDIGKVPPQFLLRDSARACRTDDALFVDLTDVKGGHVVVAFSGGRWHPPVRAEGARGVLTCSGTRAVYIGVDLSGVSEYDDYAPAPAEIHRTICSLDACTHQSVTLPDERVSRGDIKYPRVAVAALAGDVVALARLTTLRVAPLAELPRARVRILVDTASPGAGGTGMHSIALFARHDVAVLLFGTYEGQRAFRLDASGALSPIDWAR
jgi:hypothetical protein